MDDTLIHDTNLEQHYGRVKLYLTKCRENNITLNRDKFVFAKDNLKFVGYIVGKDGIMADPEKTQALKKFPTPKNLTELRSFLGLANQLGQFTDKLSGLVQPLRDLLKTKNEFIWTSTHEEAFNKIKDHLASPPILSNFNPSRETQLHTDASRTNGLGFILMQKHNEEWKMVCCGSRFISETESRYSMVELEMLAVVWAVKKCRVYLMGMKQFSIIVDHKPLESIMDKKTLN